MAEFTARMAARLTRLAIARVERALERLAECEQHFGDLDNAMAVGVRYASELPGHLADLIRDLDEIYPTTKRRTTRRAG